MNSSKKPAHGGNRGQAEGTAAGRTTDSTKQINTAAAERQGIYALLLVGAKNAQSARQLAMVAGRRPREVTKAIELLRLGGVPVCAGRHGYYLAQNEGELEKYYRAFNRRLRSIRATHAALSDMLAKASKQETFFGEG